MRWRWRRNRRVRKALNSQNDEDNRNNNMGVLDARSATDRWHFQAILILKTLIGYSIRHFNL